jgi:trimeric autotransporter adhesin
MLRCGYLGLSAGRAAGSMASARRPSSSRDSRATGSASAAVAAAAAAAIGTGGSGVSPTPASASSAPAMRTSHHSCSRETDGSPPLGQKDQLSLCCAFKPLQALVLLAYKAPLPRRPQPLEKACVSPSPEAAICSSDARRSAMRPANSGSDAAGAVRPRTAARSRVASATAASASSASSSAASCGQGCTNCGNSLCSQGVAADHFTYTTRKLVNTNIVS